MKAKCLMCHRECQELTTANGAVYQLKCWHCGWESNPLPTGDFEASIDYYRPKDEPEEDT